MTIAFEAVGDGGTPQTFDRRADGSFAFTHPGADGPNPIVVVPVTGYRDRGRAVKFGVDYGGTPLLPTRQVWGNQVSDDTPRSGWLQFFYLLNPPAGDDVPVTVSWTSPLGAQNQIQVCANSISYSGVSGVGDLQYTGGSSWGIGLSHAVAAPDDAVILQGFLQEWFSGISLYNRAERMRLDDDSTGRPYDCVIGEAPGGRSVVFTGRRTLNADWCSVALPLIAAKPQTVTPPPAVVHVTGHRPLPAGHNVVNPPPARIQVSGRPAVALAYNVARPGPAVVNVTGYEPWSGLPVFPAATVLTLRGLNLFGALNPNDMPEKFQGIFAEAPYDMHEVRYPASLADDSIERGVLSLDDALHFYPPPFIVLGQSQGAQVASAWMDEHRDDPDAPSEDELQFVLSGNPVSSKGGYLIGRPVVGGGLGVATPTDTKWLVIDVARRYEGWTDWVQNEDDPIAVQNAMSGRSLLHTRYDEVDLFDPTHTIWRNGNTLYVLTQEPEVPFFKGKPQKPSVISALRARCEAAYTNRPPNDPPVEVVDPVDSFEQGLIATILGEGQ